MEQTDDTPIADTSTPVDPMAFTKARLSEIGQVWKDFALERAEAYKEKLPSPVKQYLSGSEASAEAPAESVETTVAPESADSPDSEAH